MVIGITGNYCSGKNVACAQFEQAGFSNAIEVKIQPDDADWDAGDLRYNVLRWTSSPQPPFGGYGPSWVNPRTGQIIGSDIWWLGEPEATLHPRYRDYVYGITSDPIRGAVACKLWATGRGG